MINQSGFDHTDIPSYIEHRLAGTIMNHVSDPQNLTSKSSYTKESLKPINYAFNFQGGISHPNIHETNYVFIVCTDRSRIKGHRLTNRIS